MSGGRPSKYDPKYCEMLIEHMAKGFSFETFGAAIGVSTSSVYRWLEAEEEFREAKSKAEALSRLFFERIGLAVISGNTPENFSNVVWIFTMKNRFGWRDKTEVEQTTKAEVSLDLSNLSNEELEKMGEILDKVSK